MVAALVVEHPAHKRGEGVQPRGEEPEQRHHQQRVSLVEVGRDAHLKQQWLYTNPPLSSCHSMTCNLHQGWLIGQMQWVRQELFVYVRQIRGYKRDKRPNCLDIFCQIFDSNSDIFAKLRVLFEEVTIICFDKVIITFSSLARVGYEGTHILAYVKNIM